MSEDTKAPTTPAAMTSLERKVRTILGAVFACAPDCPGHHHYSREWSRRRVEFHAITVHLHRHQFSTFDGSGLALLVVGAHEEAVRVEIAKSGFGYVGFTFSERQREGRFFERHPTIETAVETYRRLSKVSAATAEREE